MASTRLILSAALSLTISASVLPSVSLRQEAPAQGLETAKQQWFGLVNAGAVYVQRRQRRRLSGDETGKGRTGESRRDEVQMAKDFRLKARLHMCLKPMSSAAATERLAGEREIIAKVGSSLTQQKTNPMAKVEQGQDVQIVGEEDEYYKIQPPEGSYLYINQQYVDPYKPIGTPDSSEPKPANDNSIARDTPRHDDSPEGQAKTGCSTGWPATRLPAQGRSLAASLKPATQPADPVTVASDTFDKLEGDFKAANEKSITEQPIDQLLSSYQDLLKQDALPTSMRRIAESRVATLKLRGSAKSDYLAAKAEQQKSMERRQALQAEKQEIEQRIKENQITVYAAVGTLVPAACSAGTR